MREIIGFEGFYKIDKNGNVFSIKKNNFLKPRLINSGYYMVDLFKETKRYQLLVHRLVALTFLDKNENKKIVNHKDENKLNNHVDNLEWCDYKYNLEYSNCIKKANKERSKKVVQILNGEVIKEFISMSEAGRCVGLSNSNISECCSGKRKIAGGYEWKIVL